MSDQIVFVINPAGWTSAFKSWTGLLGRYMEEKVRAVEARALIEVPAPGNPPRNRTGRNYATGRMRAGIRVDHGSWHAPKSSGPGKDLEGQISSTVSHTPHVIYGTRPHVIVPRIPGKHLKFIGKAGHIVITKHVNHPGSMANNFLERALDAAN